jgi:HPt (histidine-containing phosphotransfer) domain-containing protein
LHDELTTLYQELDALGNTPHSLADRLHRLRSSCGFCGATSLATEAAQLQSELKLAHDDQPASMTRFRTVLLATMDALKGNEA